MQAGGTVPSAARWLNHHALLPQAYLYGMVYTSEHSRTRPGFLNGEHYLDGRAAFFPYLFAVKTPLSILAAMVLAAMAWLAERKARRPGKSPPPDPTGQSLWYRTATLWVLLIGYGGLAMLSQINIGLRHFLPVYGPLFVLVGIVGRTSPRRTPGSASAIPALAVAAVAECALAAPDYLAYFNVFAGGRIRRTRTSSTAR